MPSRLARHYGAVRALVTASVFAFSVPLILAAAGHPNEAGKRLSAVRPLPGVLAESHGPYFSYYIYSKPSNALLATISSLGGEQANSDCKNSITVGASEAFLDFGVQDNAATGAWSTIGLAQPPDPFYKNSWIRVAADAFAEGYSEVASRCNTGSVQDDLLIGTNNNWPQLPTSSQAKAMADAWAAISVGVYHDYVAWGKTHPQEYGYVFPGPAIDSEPGFNGPRLTLTWADRLTIDIDKLPLIVFAHLAPQTDFGSADGCPPGGNYNNGTQCENGWTGASFNELLKDTMGAPEIYENTSTPTQAQQWTWLCVYWVKENPSSPPFSPYEDSVVLADPPYAGLSDASAWNIFISDLKASGNKTCKDNLPDYETDFTRHA